VPSTRLLAKCKLSQASVYLLGMSWTSHPIIASSLLCVSQPKMIFPSPPSIFLSLSLSLYIYICIYISHTHPIYKPYREPTLPFGRVPLALPIPHQIRAVQRGPSSRMRAGPPGPDFTITLLQEIHPLVEAVCDGREPQIVACFRKVGR
jgi:hypothetical protein